MDGVCFVNWIFVAFRFAGGGLKTVEAFLEYTRSGYNNRYELTELDVKRLLVKNIYTFGGCLRQNGYEKLLKIMYVCER